ncbi:carboxypeptidase-like regulatory domain-containing protein [Candidatus Fermentibacteria bacterium]|nr:carboxypeptidase-like regulatory domain-containing protein [Candidatus Fermentibacteria bacterium]
MRLLAGAFAGMFTMVGVAHAMVIHGTIRDRETNTPLPAANIQIAGTYMGTISNDDGAYVLVVEQVPSAILVRYIGYLSREIVITGDSSAHQDVFLEPTALEIEPITIIGEDPAVGIMRRVIACKQQWRPRLNTYRAQAYGRFLLENEDGIVTISESTSDVFWDSKRGIRELVTASHHAANFTPDEVIPVASILPNLYDDDIEMMGFRVIGVTHPDAFSHYEFRLEGQRFVDERLVFDISVTPTGKLQPTMIGRVSVLDEEFALIDADLKLNPDLPFPWPIKRFDVSCRQQFSDFGKEFWLPVDVRLDGSIRISMVGLEVPTIGMRQISAISDYRVNVPVPDSLYRDDDPARPDSARIACQAPIETLRTIPLSHEELAAYAAIDSTMTLEKAFQPRGFLARFAKTEVKTGENGDHHPAESGSRGTHRGLHLFEGLQPVLWYNRVDGLHVGAESKRSLGSRLALILRGGYRTGRKDWAYGGTLRYDLIPGGALNVEGCYYAGTAVRQSSELHGFVDNSVLTVLGYADYFDYYRIDGGTVAFSSMPGFLGSHLALGVRAEEHGSLEQASEWNIWGRNATRRENPGIGEGRLRSVEASLVAGESGESWGAVGRRSVKFQVEHSSPEILASEFDFTRYHLQVDWRLPTFLTRRPLPQVLDVRIIAGTTRGTLPLQRFGALDTSFGIVSPFGSFKTLRAKPLEGEDYFGVFWEYNLRTVPFEILGLRSLVRNNISLVLTGASGRTWICEERLASMAYLPSYKDEFHHELGVSVNGILGMVRVDLSTPLGDDAWFGRVSIARMF